MKLPTGAPQLIAATAIATALATAGCYEDRTPDDGSTDGDGDAANPWADSDGDTILDGDEGVASLRDSDADTVPDYLDEDSDGDGLTDAAEAGDADTSTAPVDSDADGDPDFADRDSDGNGILDGDEASGDTDGDTLADRIDMDDDGDACMDSLEGSASAQDTDEDTIPDHLDEDSDADGLTDEQEGCLEDCDGDFVPNRVVEDSDGSGVPDGIEGTANTDAESATGPDDVPDWCDDDNDGDGIDDLDEITLWATDPNLWDSDGDGDFDLLEIVAGTDPLDEEVSLPEDTLLVGPLLDPVDIVVTTSIPRLDVAIVAGTGGDIAGEVAAIETALAAGLVDIRAEVPDLEIAVVAFEDFGAQGYGPAEGEAVFAVRASTSDDAEIQAGLSALSARAALMDGTIATHASALEAIHQVTTGEGLGGGLIPHASCPTSPLEPSRFGSACLREDAYTILAVVSDRIARNGPGCYMGSTSCSYDEDDFPPDGQPRAYPEVGGAAWDAGVRVLGLVPDPASDLGSDPAEWLERLSSDTGSVDGDEAVFVIEPGDDPAACAQALVQAIVEMVTVSPFDAEAAIVDLPDAAPQPEASVTGYFLSAFPVACDPASGPWGECGFSAGRMGGVGPGVDVTIRLSFMTPPVHAMVEVLAFELRVLVEGRMLIETRRGYLIVPQTSDPEI